MSECKNRMLLQESDGVQIAGDKIIETVSNCLEECIEPMAPISMLQCSSSKPIIIKEQEDLKLDYDLVLPGLQFDFSKCNLKEIPVKVFTLTILRDLDLSNNAIESLPEEIGNLVHLRDFNISGNKLETLPMSIKHLVNLRKINLASNNLSGILDGLEHLHQLQVLNLSENNINEAPDLFFSSLSNIIHLDLSHNMLCTFGKVRSPLCAAKLQFLNLSYNQLTKIPVWLYATCRSLTELNLSHNQYLMEPKDNMGSSHMYSPCGGMFYTLKCLNLSDCNVLVNDSWDFLRKFVRLNKLHLGNEVYEPAKLKNLIYDVPVTSLMSSSLTELYMPAASLSYLPENISMLKFLKILDLQRNELGWLPNSFCHLQSLEKCLLSQNKLVMLPNNVGSLIALTELTLSGNCEIHSLPQSFNLLHNLVYLDLYNNHFDEVPECITHLSALEGLDLEYNFCQTENMSNFPQYDKLKQTMRCRVLNGNARVCGVKQKPDPVEEYDDDSFSDFSSSSDISEENFPEDPDEGRDPDNDCQPQEDDRTWSSTDVKKGDENWGTVVDDDDWVPPDITYSYKLCVEVIPVWPRPWRRATFRRADFSMEEAQFDD